MTDIGDSSGCSIRSGNKSAKITIPFMERIAYLKEVTIMFKALKEYNEMVMKPSNEWMKRHWKGYSIFLLASFMAGFVSPAIYERVIWKKRA